MRLIVLVLLVVLAVWLIRRALRGPAPGKTSQVKEADLVRCAHCGVHLPRSEARETQGLLYCSEEHARLGRR
jgi:uncharacterized protein